CCRARSPSWSGVFHCYRYPRDLHAFPTRRSSDLPDRQRHRGTDPDDLRRHEARRLMPVLPLELPFDSPFLAFGGPALLCGLLLGITISWLLARGRRKRLEQSLQQLETRLKDQDALQRERDSAFEAATSRLAAAFSELANQSLKSNSENFLRLAEQNLSAHQAKARHELSERERAVENLVKPIQEAITRSQQQIAELEKARR